MAPRPTFGFHNAPPNNPGSLQLLLNLALHRFFTFPGFKDWHHPISRVDFANNGYYFLSVGHAVQCYYCHLKLTENLRADDGPLESLHHNFSPRCPLLTGRAIQDITINDCTNYRYQSNRLYSMLTTDFCVSVSPYDLSEHGFYWSGQSDNCVCVFCRLEVREWESGDSAEYEHRRWNPNCVFINKRSVGNVSIGKELDQDTRYKIRDQEICLSGPYKIATAVNLLCLLCGIKHVEMVYLPCGHMITCRSCVEKKTNCIRCGVTFVAYVHAFLQ